MTYLLPLKILNDRAERHDLPLFLSPFLFPPKKRGEKEKENE